MIEVRIAQSEKELFESYKLRYDTYLKLGRLTPHPSKMFIDSLDESYISKSFIACIDDKVIGTIRITKDQSAGNQAFLVDELFKENIDIIRQNSKTAVYEISRAMVDKTKSFGVLFSLLNGIYEYAINSNINDFVAQSHPRDFKNLYERLGFETIGETKLYEKVNDLAIPLYWDVSKTTEKYKSLFKNNKISKINL